MPAQLRLFPPSRPLTERFGRDFFLSIPKQPGVYRMADGSGKIIYIGKAKNLRNRVGSYRFVNPETASRKTIRLIHAVESISYEVLPSDLDAQLRENLLLRTHRPKFNRANVYPKAYCFIALNRSNPELVLTRELLDDHDHFGAFKGTAFFAFAALKRLLWVMEKERYSIAAMPAALLKERSSGKSRFAFQERLLSPVVDYLKGTSDELIHALESAPQLSELSHFEQNFYAADVELLRDFHVRSAGRNQELRQQFGIEKEIVEQELLNDLLLQSRFANAQQCSSVSGGNLTIIE